MVISPWNKRTRPHDDQDSEVLLFLNVEIEERG